MLSKSVIALFVACTSVLAAPLEVRDREARSYGVYDGYGKYGSYDSYPAAVQARDVERRHVDYGKYAT